MSLSWVVGYVGLVLACTVAGFCSILLLARLIGAGPDGTGLARRVWPALFAALFFVLLTQLPLPDPDQMSCPISATQPSFTAFRMLPQAQLLWQEGAGALLRDRIVATAAMNLLLCALIGAALVPLVAHAATALLFGVLLSGTVELAQLTGMFGLYPCAWRQFDVDDLIMNISGVLIGFLIARPALARFGVSKD